MNDYRLLNIPVDDVMLKGDLHLAEKTHGLIIFSHGSGSSRLSSRNKAVAAHLQKNNFSTLLFDLLTEIEDADYYTRFDIQLLTRRLIATTKWIKKQVFAQNTSIGFFGASTGAASAIQAAAQLEDVVEAVVSRGGRPDLADTESLKRLNCPTLLIVGSLDREVLKLNRSAYAQLTCEKELKIVEGATHLFEEPGKLNEVSKLAAEWFTRYLIVKV